MDVPAVCGIYSNCRFLLRITIWISLSGRKFNIWVSAFIHSFIHFRSVDPYRGV